MNAQRLFTEQRVSYPVRKNKIIPIANRSHWYHGEMEKYHQEAKLQC